MKTTSLLFIAVLLHYAANSQLKSQSPKQFRFGIRTALAYSNLYGAKNYTSYPSGTTYSLDKDNFLPGYSAGVWAGYSMGLTSLVVEANITEKGQSNSFPRSLNTEYYHITLKPRLQYLCVPVMFQYNLKNFNRLGLYAGMEYAWLISAKQQITGNYDPGTTDITSDFKRFDVGIVAGVNLQVFKSTLIDLRLVNGVQDVSLEREATFVTNKSMQLGLKFFIGK